jgi:hypothetical protein
MSSATSFVLEGGGAFGTRFGSDAAATAEGGIPRRDLY